MLGINVGAMVHILAAALGLSALLASSALAFSVVKYAGAAYLIYLGVQKLRSKSALNFKASAEPRSLSHTFYQGIVVNILNSKAVLFFFAFLPQFIDVSAPSAALQILFLCFAFLVVALLGDSIYALLAGAVRGLLRSSQTFVKRKST